MEEYTNIPRNVLVAVDVQNDFIDGSLAVSKGEQVVPIINELAAQFRKTKGDVIFTRDWHPPATPHFDTWPVHCVAGTEGADFASNLNMQPSDIIISKGMGQTDGYSGWEGIGPEAETLETLIEPRDSYETVRVFIGGLATDYCVKATALDVANHFASNEQVTIYLIRDAIRAVNLQFGDEAVALRALEDAGVVAISSTELKRQFLEA